MISLLKAEYKRFFKSIIFYFMFIVSIGVSVTVIQNIYGVNWDVVLDDGFYFSFCIDFQFTANILVSIFVAAVFIPIFIGREFSDRVINNKVLSGVKRSHIFLTEFIVCSSAVLIFQTFTDVLTLVVAKIVLSRFPNQHVLSTPLADMLFIKIGYAFALIVCCAFNVLLCMSIGSRRISIIVSILVYFIFHSASSQVYSEVLPVDVQMDISNEVFGWSQKSYLDTADEPERQQKTYQEIQEDLHLKEITICNRYNEVKGERLTGAKKYLYMVLNDILPENQFYNSYEWVAADQASPSFPRYIMYDLIITAIILVIGVLIFERKELN
ncbi:MAG: ABC transporter permease subunit [Acutalibacteraceae bacterium]|nr:ABC transporter permease subunit [Acutalibacteraceae bacterium]